MIEPATPRDEAKRLAALHALGILDSKPEAAFEAVVELTKALLDVPMALVSLVDRDRQWFMAKVGLAASETSRSVSFCAHAIHEPEVFVVPDATFDPRFHDNPLVVGEPHIRFYAGFPLQLPSGERIGTLCALSPVARENFDGVGRTRLRLLGGMVLDAIELRTKRAELSRARATLNRHDMLLHALSRPVAFTGPDGRIETCNAAFALVAGGTDPVGRPVADALRLPPGAWAPATESAVAGRIARIEGVGLPVGFAVHGAPDGYAFIGDLTKA
ncbi:MAG: GAF domain-containing protein [Alphaproteobacteria bacterium]|nr:GAF domain-containing protein [Alphaproteobacteria bacterium]